MHWGDGAKVASRLCGGTHKSTFVNSMVNVRFYAFHECVISRVCG